MNGSEAEPADAGSATSTLDLTDIVHRHLLSALAERGLADHADLVVGDAPDGPDHLAADQVMAAVPPGTPPATGVLGVSPPRPAPAPQTPARPRREPQVHVHVDRVVVVRTPPAPPARPSPPPSARPPARTAPAVDHTAYLARRREGS